MRSVFLAVEDELSEVVGRKMIAACLTGELYIQPLRGGGAGYLTSRIDRFIDISQRELFFLIIDLDRVACAALLKQRLLGRRREIPNNFLFRVAVREIEAWLMADRASFSQFLGVNEHLVPLDVEGLDDPKRSLLAVAGRSKREVKRELLPARGVNAVQGLGYNAMLSNYVRDHWDPDRAAANSNSLERACRRLRHADRQIETD